MHQFQKRNYQLQWMKDRRSKYLDGKTCFFCDTDQGIEIHHLDPESKEDHKIWSWTDERIQAELIKCIYICSDCHTKFHALMRRVPLIHGTLNGYDKYKCRCALCRAKKEYHRKKPKYDELGIDALFAKFNRIYGVNKEFIERMVL